MKKILMSLFTIAMVSALITGGAFAIFYDVEEVGQNVFTAGTLDLTVNDENPCTQSITVGDIKPGWTGHYYFILKNVGTIGGQPSIEFANIVNYENGRNEPEIAAGDTYGDLDGELGGFLYVLMKWRQGSESWHEIKMVMNGHTFLNYLTGPYGLGENNGPPIPVLNQDEDVEIELRPWWHPRSDDNKGQSDSVKFDLIFHLDQA